MFAHVADRDEDDIDLGVAALLIGDWRYPNLDVARYVGVLDDIAAQVAVRAATPDGPATPVQAINRVLFGELGLRGNDADYYDPRNSFLHEVLDRRLGIPISLSVVYIEVARRLGVDARGVGFPGHFLVRHDIDDGSMIIDPYRCGAVLDSGDLAELLQAVAGPEAELTGALLEPASKRSILLRMLSNLAAIYRRHDDSASALEVLERSLVLEPDSRRIENEIARLRSQTTEVN
jgi:regulator of sirC expression with transglutaminase-like and TPR domain